MFVILNPQVWILAARQRSTREEAVPREWLGEGVCVAEVGEALPLFQQAKVVPLQLGVDVSPTERSVLVVRFPSGALEFYLPLEEPPAGRRGGDDSRLEYFQVELPAGSTSRRGVVGEALQLVLLRISGKLADSLAERGLPVAARRLERWLWRRAGLSEGWHRVELDDGQMVLRRGAPQPGLGRVLLLLHGTFSSTRASFSALLRPAVVRRLQSSYPGGIFGFEHYSFSRSLADNLRDLGRELGGTDDEEGITNPGKSVASEKIKAGDCKKPSPIPADLVAYSRGGLLARLLLEQSWFHVGQVILCAVPNRGTPLASGTRWRESLGWLANLLELSPDHPLIDGAALVAHGLTWLATRLTKDLPGLVDMNPESELLQRLAECRPSIGGCAVVAANFHPEGSALQRMLDLGAERFFTEPNDLVVPDRGAWDLGAGNDSLPDTSIVCFGPGGNVANGEGSVQHLNLLRRDESIELIERALSGEPLRLEPFSRNRFEREVLRLRSQAVSSYLSEAKGFSEMAAVGVEGQQTWGSQHRAGSADRSLQIMILGRADSLGFHLGAWRLERRRGGEAIILATYGGARVFQPFSLSGRSGDTLAGKRFQRIITIHEKINQRLAGERDRLPSARELRELGANLFATLFSGPVSHLYDVARTEQGNERLNIVITCSIPWLAGKPWELAWDPLRRKFLATEDVHFVRSVFTAVPAERVSREQRPLRILIVEAQPIDAAYLSIEVERKRIMHRFRDLVTAGAAELSVLVGARPETLHERLVEATHQRRPFDIVHFIGHGDFDSNSREGCLLMLGDSSGRAVAVGVQTLRELLCNRGLQLVFLNACDTARQPGARDRGLAQSLVEAGLPAVVANQFPVLDPSAVAFAERFYWGLAQGSSLGAAAREARIAVNYSADREAIDWAVPVLYARDPDEVLCRPPARRLEPLASQRSGSAPPAAAVRSARVARVGIADLSRDFPDLDEMLSELTAAQDYFEFFSVKINSPIDVWRRQRDRTSGKERTYLVANELAEQLRDDVRQMGVDYLACVTGAWVSESASGDQNLLGWWSDERDCPVLVLSTAGLGLSDDKSTLRRVIANEFAVCCCGHLHDAYAPTDSGIIHLDGPLDSLFRYDPMRTGSTIVSLLKVYEPQREGLLRAIPRRAEPNRLISAIERILENH